MLKTVAASSEDYAHRSYDDEECGCTACTTPRNDYGDAIGLHGGFVHAYDAVPDGGWALKRITHDTDTYYLGVELETDAGGEDANGDYVDPNLTYNQAIMLAKPRSFWIAKHDGSVSGPEFCSMPATLAYWKYVKPSIAKMFDALIHAGYRSYDNDTCGMHVSISRTAFDSASHLTRMLTLIHVYEDFSLAMSQRSEDSAGEWAKLNLYSLNKRRHVAHAGIRGEGSADRYTALNSPKNEPRFEFRLPRGTLRLDRFYKNLEWTHAMVEFTRPKRRLADVNPVTFLAYIEEHKDRYPNLHSFVKIWFSYATDSRLRLNGPSYDQQRQIDNYNEERRYRETRSRREIEYLRSNGHLISSVAESAILSGASHYVNDRLGCYTVIRGCGCADCMYFRGRADFSNDPITSPAPIAELNRTTETLADTYVTFDSEDEEEEPEPALDPFVWYVPTLPPSPRLIPVSPFIERTN